MLPALSLVISFGIVLAVAPIALPALQRLKIGQTIYELGPESHKKKQGTPTMGGLMIALGTLGAALIAHPARWLGINDWMLALLAFALFMLLIGFSDDYIKVVKKRSLGLTAVQKLVLQVFGSLAFSVYCYLQPDIGSSIRLPFSATEWDLGLFYIPLMTLTVMFITNSANLQDGLDGLLSSVTAIGASFFGIIALLPLAIASSSADATGNPASLAVFAFALVGACLGFLRYNFYPAKVFMGDTGSMFIGGAVVGLAMLLRQPFLLLLITFTMVMSSVSVILQRIYFKLTHGKRIFRMSPIHHHFELGGMKETHIVAMYTGVTLFLSLIAVCAVFPSL